MKLNHLLLTASLLFVPVLVRAQGSGVSPDDLLKPLKDSWPTYNGDYSAKRYSALTQVNRTNVQHLTLAWMTRLTPGLEEPSQSRGRGRRENENVPVIVGGEGPGDIAIRGGRIKASVLEVDGTLYFTMPDNAWAVDARDGHELWRSDIQPASTVAAATATKARETIFAIRPNTETSLIDKVGRNPRQ